MPKLFEAWQINNYDLTKRDSGTFPVALCHSNNTCCDMLKDIPPEALFESHKREMSQ